MNWKEAFKTVVNNRNWQLSLLCLVLVILSPLLIFINETFSIIICFIFLIGWLYWSKKFIDQVENMFIKIKP
jgi:hypothetical protein